MVKVGAGIPIHTKIDFDFACAPFSRILNLAILHRDPAVGGPGDVVAVGDDHQGEPALARS